MINDAALADAIKKIRKLRLIDHIPIKDEPPPALTFLAIMKRGLGGMYEDAALEYIFRRFLRYYAAAAVQGEHHDLPGHEETMAGLNSLTIRKECGSAPSFAANKREEMRDLAEYLERYRLSDPHIGPDDCDLIVAALSALTRHEGGGAA